MLTSGSYVGTVAASRSGLLARESPSGDGRVVTALYVMVGAALARATGSHWVIQLGTSTTGGILSKIAEVSLDNGLAPNIEYRFPIEPPIRMTQRARLGWSAYAYGSPPPIEHLSLLPEYADPKVTPHE